LPLLEQDLLCPVHLAAPGKDERGFVATVHGTQVRPLLTTPRGERVLDFGQNLAGRVRFTVSGETGQRVILRNAEVLDAEGNFYAANLRSVKARVEYVLKGGSPETYEPRFAFQGFRYVAIDEFPGEPSIEHFVAVVIHSDMRATGAFSCSHSLLNALDHNIRWSLKGNFIEIPTDCPQRDERLGWTGDAQVFIRTAYRLQFVLQTEHEPLERLSSENQASGVVALRLRRGRKRQGHYQDRCQAAPLAHSLLLTMRAGRRGSPC
jgi:alpha-L-rhamnosidase